MTAFSAGGRCSTTVTPTTAPSPSAFSSTPIGSSAIVGGCSSTTPTPAYPLDALKKASVLHEQGRVVFWYGPTRTAAAYRVPTFAKWTFTVDPRAEAAPFVDKRTGGHWDITGRGAGGGPMLPWLDGV